MPRIPEKISINFLNRLQPYKGDRVKTRFQKKFIVLGVIVFMSLGFFSPHFAAGSDIIKEDIIKAIEKKYAQKSFEAKFAQISKLAALDIIEKASGRAFFSHPGRMRWQYFKPEHHEIITNGKILWIFRPSENQVMQGDASNFFKSGAGGAFLSDITLIRKKYNISIKEITADYAEINLVPVKEDPQIASIVIRVSQKNSEITRVVTSNPYDDTTIFEFSDIKFKKFDPGLFEFTIPKGTDIIKMD